MGVWVAILRHLFILLEGHRGTISNSILILTSLFQNSWRWFSFWESPIFNSDIFIGLLTRGILLCCQHHSPTCPLTVVLLNSSDQERKSIFSPTFHLLMLYEKEYLAKLASDFSFITDSWVLVLPIFSSKPTAIRYFLSLYIFLIYKMSITHVRPLIYTPRLCKAQI